MKKLIWLTCLIMMIVCSCNKNDDQSEGNETKYYYSDDICECADQELIQVLNNDTLIFPSAISPNGDGVNDRLQIFGIWNIPENTVKFLDRHNNVLIQFSPFTDYWDGTYNSNGTTVTAENGKYYYEVTSSGETKKGIFLLISSTNPSIDPYFDIKPSESECNIIAGLIDPDDHIFQWK